MYTWTALNFLSAPLQVLWGIYTWIIYICHIQPDMEIVVDPGILASWDPSIHNRVKLVEIIKFLVYFKIILSCTYLSK